jgi:hypothetical protein
VIVKRLSALLVLVPLTLALAASARADVQFGVAEDAGKYASDGGAAFFATLGDVGMTQNRIAIFWNPAQPTTIQERAFLDRSMPQALLRGTRILFSVQPARPTDVTSTPNGPQLFAAYTVLLARTYPQVKDFIVGNEPNQPRFWQPQFVGGKGVSAAAYEQTLALSYDALKAFDPTIRVIGVGLSPRGNDNPRASSNISTSPVRFIRDLGAAYRASGRMRPIMDELAFHPYPNPSSANDPLTKGYQWPNAGVPNLDRIKQAFWDAFNGTGQPTVAEAGGTRRLAMLAPAPADLVLDETGWQTSIPAESREAYTGVENSKTVSEATQARIYGDLIRLLACDPGVASLNFFHLVDEIALAGFQSGFVRADGSQRASYDSVKAAIAQTGGKCLGRQAAWRHLNTVDGAEADFSANVKTRFGFGVTAEEGATFRAGIFRARGKRGLSGDARSAMAAALAGGGSSSGLVSRASGGVRAYWQNDVEFAAGSLAPGRYVYAVRLAAETNPERTTLLVGKPFRVR